MSNWESFHKKTEQLKPSRNLVEALEYTEERGSALDLGAGALSGTKHLLNNGFEKVVAVDKTEGVKDIGDALDDERLEVVISSFEDFEFPEGEFDLITAQLSLPFMNKDDFDRVFSDVKKSLKEGGIFTGQLFGANDDWSSDPTRTFHTREEAEALFEDMNLLKLEEIEKEMKTASGPMKHGHLFSFISEK